MQKITLIAGLTMAVFSGASLADNSEVTSLQFSDKFEVSQSQLGVDKTKSESFDSVITPQDTAEGITYYQVLGVKSSQYGGV
ncbi:hypothetical protein U0358_01175 [Idiomarina sp. PL1-037]|uniref:hypothetical protein n=1 Tax=Idiomarina sp. PL1-037 TaxID=3095365 RepID=UPI002ACC252A|nr:hypothetical protein [Idiomarina sp. PL1-037]WQC53196.1 hypothetical protein U0358_01175 [Idiomarina sp. PL1-037]